MEQVLSRLCFQSMLDAGACKVGKVTLIFNLYIIPIGSMGIVYLPTFS